MRYAKSSVADKGTIHIRTLSLCACALQSDAPLERLVHIVEKSEQFNQSTVAKPDNGSIYTLATPAAA